MYPYKHKSCCFSPVIYFRKSLSTWLIGPKNLSSKKDKSDFHLQILGITQTWKCMVNSITFLSLTMIICQGCSSWKSMVKWPLVRQILQVFAKTIAPKNESNIDPNIDPWFDPKTDPKLHNLFMFDNSNMPRITQVFILEIHGGVVIS